MNPDDSPDDAAAHLLNRDHGAVVRYAPSAPPMEPLTKRQVGRNVFIDLLPDLVYSGGVAVAAFMLRDQADLSANGTSAASVVLNTFLVSRLVKGGFQVMQHKLHDDVLNSVKTNNDRWFYASVFAGVLAVAAAGAGVAGMLDVDSPLIRKMATYVAPIVAAIMSEVCPALYEQHLRRARHQAAKGSACGTAANLLLSNLGSLAGVVTVTFAAYQALSNPATAASEFMTYLALGLAGNFIFNTGNQLRVMHDRKLEESPQLDIEFAVSPAVRRLFGAARLLRYFAIILAGGALLGREASEEGSGLQVLSNVGMPVAFLLLQLSVTLESIAQEDAMRQQRKGLRDLAATVRRGGQDDSGANDDGSLTLVELNADGQPSAVLPRFVPSYSTV